MTQEMKVQDICSEEHYKYMSGFDYNLHLPPSALKFCTHIHLSIKNESIKIGMKLKGTMYVCVYYAAMHIQVSK